MSVLIAKIATGRPATFLNTTFETVGGAKAICNRLMNFISGVYTGTELAVGSGTPPSISISVQDNTTQATGTFTLTSVIATNTVSINGVTFTAVASGATGNQFNVGVDDTATATNLAAAINASVTALVAGYVTAAAASNVVTITSAFHSISGNQTDIASGQGTIVASGSKLTGGLDDATAVVLSF